MPFVRLWLVLAVIGLLAFTSLVGVAQALPPIPHPILAALAGTDICPVPCFMGIRPGITSANDALDLLEAQHWIGHIEAASFESGVEFFTWSAQRPDVMNADEWASVGIENNIVKSLRVPTHLRLGDLWALYGGVEWWSLDENQAYGGFNQHGFVAGFTLPTEARQLRSMKRFLWSPVTLYFIRAED